MTMSTSSQEPSEPRSLIRYALIALAITIITLWVLYQVRSTLLLIYVCVLFATGSGLKHPELFPVPAQSA